VVSGYGIRAIKKDRSSYSSGYTVLYSTDRTGVEERLNRDIALLSLTGIKGLDIIY
jgi:hypothetical protein